MISSSSSAAAARLSGGRSSLSAAAGRRSSMSVRVSTASDPFAPAGRPRVPVGLPAANRGVRRLPQPRQPVRLGPQQTVQRIGPARRGNPGYLVIPASALMQFLASRSRGGVFPYYNPGFQGISPAGVHPGVRGIFRPPRQRLFGLPAVGSVQGFGRVIDGAGPSYNIVPIGPTLTGSPPGYFGAPGTIARSQVPGFSISSINSLNNQRSLPGQIANGNNIIIQEAGSMPGQPGGSIVIGANGGTITIRGFGGGGGGEQEEFEFEEMNKKTKDKKVESSAKNTTAVEKPIVLSTGGAKPQTIVIGGAGGTFTIGDKTSGPGNATFILNSATTPRTGAM